MMTRFITISFKLVVVVMLMLAGYFFGYNRGESEALAGSWEIRNHNQRQYEARITEITGRLHREVDLRLQAMQEEDKARQRVKELHQQAEEGRKLLNELATLVSRSKTTALAQGVNFTQPAVPAPSIVSAVSLPDTD